MIRFLMRHKTWILWLAMFFYLLRQTSFYDRDDRQVAPDDGRSPYRVQRLDEPQLYFHGVPADYDDDDKDHVISDVIGGGDDDDAPRSRTNRHEAGLRAAERTAHAHRSGKEEEAADWPGRSRGDRPRLKRILYWTKYFRARHFQFGFGQWPFIHYNCPVDTCTTTDDKSTVMDADVIVFHGPLIRKLPEVRRPGQIYVFVQKEPWLERSNRTLAALNDVINLTMTYRLDSDVVLPYGYVFRNASLPARRPPVDPTRRRRSVVWPVSHCRTESRRELYADQLAKHIDVDVYGDCGPLRCPKEKNPDCWRMFGRDYRFALAFENQACRDYVTEKAYRPLAAGVVPIVYGGADYERLLPRRSYIDVRDYPDPRHLARHLKYLARNGTAYDEYFRWTDGGHQVETYKEALMAKAFCQLCAIVNNRHFKYRRYKDLRKWWVDGACDNSLMERLKTSWARA